jgi:sporulation related protein
MSHQFEPAEFDRPEELLGDQREGEEPPPQRILAVAAALAVMAVFAAGLWFAYYEGIRHAGGSAAGDVPLIRADRRPMMVRPAEPGGLKIPDRNMLIYDPGRRMAEHLLPLPEQPMARPTPAAPHGEIATPTAAPMGAPISAASASLVPAPGAAAPGPAATPHGAPPARTGSVRLQLGSVRSANAARLEWNRLRQQNADLLGSFLASAVRADLGGKGVYYRIQTGPVGDLAALRICGELKQRKVGCIIVR